MRSRSTTDEQSPDVRLPASLLGALAFRAAPPVPTAAVSRCRRVGFRTEVVELVGLLQHDDPGRSHGIQFVGDRLLSLPFSSTGSSQFPLQFVLHRSVSSNIHFHNVRIGGSIGIGPGEARHKDRTDTCGVQETSQCL